METLKVLDSIGTEKYLGGRGAGTSSIPFIPIHEDFKLAVALGEIDGIVQFDKFGSNDDIDIGTAPQDLWNGGNPYTGFPTGSAETMEIFSSSANDTGAGTGARTVTISNLLDGSGNEMPNITVTLNGITAVSLGAQTYYRASRIVVDTAGSGGENAGTITLRHTITTANIFANMKIGHNQTSIMAFTVPVGKKILINRGLINMGRNNGSAGSAEVSIRRRIFGTDTTFQAIRDVGITDGNGYKFESGGFMVFNARDDVKATVESVSDNNTFVNAESDGYMITI